MWNTHRHVTPSAAPVGTSAKEVTPSTEKRPQNGEERKVVSNTSPVLHVEPICARLRQLRVVLQELEQDDDKVVTPRPETQHRGHEQKQKRKFGQKGRLTKNKKERELFITGIFPAREFILNTFLIKKNRRRGKLQSLQFYINSKTIGL